MLSTTFSLADSSLPSVDLRSFLEVFCFFVLGSSVSDMIFLGGGVVAINDNGCSFELVL